MTHGFDHERYRVAPGETIALGERSTRCDVDGFSKSDARETLEHDRRALAEAQRVLYADNTRSLLVIFQAMDAAGKDGTIRHVMSGVNPQGCSVTSFKAPSSLEAAHHFLWRAMPYLPSKGQISIFNRSYYEETLVVRVHPKWLAGQSLPVDVLDPNTITDAGIAAGGPPESFWEQRFAAINGLEQQLADAGTSVLKFYLHVSKDEQRERFLERIETPEKNWKFSAGDVRERQHWDEYQAAFESLLPATSRPHAPWFVIPADQKWFMRALVADIISKTITDLDLAYPNLPPDEQRALVQEAERLRSEK